MSAIVCDEPNGWMPVRDGDVYCSPRCGYRCTWQAYQDAVAGANALCAMLGAAGEWKPRVWENGGWHYEAGRGNATVAYHGTPKHAPKRRPEFSCWVRFTVRGGGSHQVAYTATHHEDPRAAVHAALALWRADLDAADREYAGLLAGTAPAGAIISATSPASAGDAA